MGGKRTNKKNKTKLNKKMLLAILLLAIIVTAIVIILTNKSVNVGKINKDGKAEYIERIVNVTKYEDSKIIEFKNEYELIDNGIMTTEIYEKMKNNDALYNLPVKDYMKLNDLTAKESYNLNKAVQLEIVKEDTSYADYFAKTCGFANKNELLKYTEAVFKLADKEK